LRKERFNASCHKGKLVPLAAEIPSEKQLSCT
jgi:hypothetical protein